MTLILEQYGRLVPRIEDYFATWAIRPEVARHLAAAVNTMDLAAHIRATRERMATDAGGDSQQDAAGYVEDGIGYLFVQGVLMRRQTSLSMGTSTTQLRQELRRQAADPNVKSIVMLIDSPGGEAAGVGELAADIRRLRDTTPVYALVDGMCCSGAYWIASAATSITATPSATIGSIGVFVRVDDTSEQAKQNGVTVHVIKAGDFKAIGMDGVPVTQEQIDMIRVNLVEPTYREFMAAIQSGRGLSADAVAAVATGEMWHTQAALKLGLVDAMGDAGDFVRQLKESLAMAEQQANAPKAASLSELKASLVGASSEFILSQLEAGATLVDALTAHAAVTTAQLAAERSARALAEEQKAAAQAGAKLLADDTVDGLSSAKPRGKANSGGIEEDSDAPATQLEADKQQFAQLVEQEQVRSGVSKMEAYSRVCASHTHLLERIHRAANAGRRGR